MFLKKKYFWIEWWNFKWNSAIIQDWGSHCAFSSNLFHGQITQKAIHQLRDPEKEKNVAFEKFLEQTTLKLCKFWAGEALEAQTRNCLNITTPWNKAWIPQIFERSGSFQVDPLLHK